MNGVPAPLQNGSWRDVADGRVHLRTPVGKKKSLRLPEKTSWDLERVRPKWRSFKRHFDILTGAVSLHI